MTDFDVYPPELDRRGAYFYPVEPLRAAVDVPRREIARVGSEMYEAAILLGWIPIFVEGQTALLEVPQ